MTDDRIRNDHINKEQQTFHPFIATYLICMTFEPWLCNFPLTLYCALPHFLYVLKHQLYYHKKWDYLSRAEFCRAPRFAAPCAFPSSKHMALHGRSELLGYTTTQSRNRIVSKMASQFKFQEVESFYRNSSFELLTWLCKMLNFTSSYLLEG